MHDYYTPLSGVQKPDYPTAIIVVPNKDLCCQVECMAREILVSLPLYESNDHTLKIGNYIYFVVKYTISLFVFCILFSICFKCSWAMALYHGSFTGYFGLHSGLLVCFYQRTEYLATRAIWQFALSRIGWSRGLFYPGFSWLVTFHTTCVRRICCWKASRLICKK